MKSYLFTVSISSDSFSKKSDINFSKLIYYRQNNITLTNFIYYVSKGYCYCHNFFSEEITQSQKKLKNFESAFFIPVDIDKVDINMYNFISKLSIKPTFAYTTYSDNQTTHSFRLIYALNKAIRDASLYKEVYFNIIRKIEEETHIKNKDNCAQSAAQQFTSNPNAEFYYSNPDLNNLIIYSIEDFNKKEMLHSNSIIKEERNIIKLECNIQEENKKCNSDFIIIKEENIIKLEMHFSKDFLNDYWNLDYKTFLDKYINVYQFFTHTELPEVNDDTAYILLPENYLEIKRYWILDKQSNEEGETIKINSHVRKIKDGENRRKKLFINGILRRFMKSDINYEYMLTMLIYELYYFIDNRKDTITKKDIFSICKNVMQADLSKYTELSIQEHPKFIVNDNYCIKYNINRKQARNIAKKQINYNEIGNLYDCSISDKENLKIMKEFGLSISRDTLIRFKKENGLTRNYNKKEMLHSNSIIKKERNIIKLECNIQEENNNIELESPIQETNNNNNNNIEEITHSDFIIIKKENIIESERVIQKENNNIELECNIQEENNNNNNNIEEIEDDITIYNNQYPDYVNKFITEHCNKITEELINQRNKENTNNINIKENNYMETKKLISNVNLLLTKLNKIDIQKDLEQKYLLLNDYIAKNAENKDDMCLLLKYANKKYLRIKENKKMDFLFEEFNFSTLPYFS